MPTNNLLKHEGSLTLAERIKSLLSFLGVAGVQGESGPVRGVR